MRRFVSVVCVLAAGLVACEAEPPECSRSMASDIFGTMIDGFNATVGRNGSGSNWSCPGGGSAHFSTLNGSATMVTYDVTFDHCNDTAASILGDLTLTGPVHAVENVAEDAAGSGGYCVDCAYTSDALKLEGSNVSCNADMIDATCPVTMHVMQTATLDMETYKSTICGIAY